MKLEKTAALNYGTIKTSLTADVVVAGAGPGGIGAAVFAARKGAKVLLVEQYGIPGGMASTGEVQPFMPNGRAGECLDRPVFTEWRGKIGSYMPPAWRGVNLSHTSWLSPCAAAMAAEELLLEAGVALLYHHTLVGVEMDGKRIGRAILHSKSGFSAVTAKNFVDATGDGDLAAYAGCSFRKGDEDGVCQPMTTNFKVSGVDVPDNSELTGWNESLQAIFKRGKAEGKISSPRESLLYFIYCEEGVVHFNTTRIINHDPLNGESLSDAETVSRKQIREIFKYLKENAPAFKNSYISSIGATIGVRESRRIDGIRVITREDFANCSKFPDGIARCDYWIDKHSGKGPGTFGIEIKKGDFYEIPYGCIVPRDADNLTIAGRPISVDVYIHSSMRIMPCACTVGQAAGYAAAECAATGKTPAGLDGRSVREGLKAMGAFL